MKKQMFLFITVLLCVLAGVAFADDDGIELDVRTGFDRMFGYTLYAIGWNYFDVAGNGYTIGYKLSELRFPLDAYWAFADIGVRFLDHWNVRAGFRKNVYAELGTMEDSDWGVWYLEGNPWADSSTLDVFSESECSLVNAYEINCDASYRETLLPGLDVSLGLGFVFQYHSFSVANLDQWYPSYDRYSDHLDPVYGEHVLVDGEVGTYEIMNIVPLLVCGARVTIIERLVLDASLGYTPVVKSFDADDHILRSKMSHGELVGSVFRFVFDARWSFNDNFYCGCAGSFMYLGASGRQYQELYNDTPEGDAGPTGSIDQKIESLQFMLRLYIGIRFANLFA